MLLRHARNSKGAGPAVNVLDTNLFGPQSCWSVLVGQREHLQSEIDRGRNYLKQVKKDCADWEALVAEWSSPATAGRPNGRSRSRGPGIAAANMEQLLSEWLVQLQKQLAAVNAEIARLDPETAAAVTYCEESMFALLRAAG